MSEERFAVDKPTEEMIKTIARARDLTREYYFTPYENKARRSEILGELLGEMGVNVAIDTPFHCDYGKNIFLGDNVIININCTFVDNARITVGNQVMIASNVQFYTATHTPEPEDRIISESKEPGTAWFRTYAEPITVEDGVWIGGGAIILPGVTIGKNSVIGAGSVVNRSIPANCVAVGNPCRPIRFFGDKK